MLIRRGPVLSPRRKVGFGAIDHQEDGDLLARFPIATKNITLLSVA